MKPEILARIQEKLEGKYYGKHRGVVVDNDDPEKLGRLKVRVPSVLGHDVVTGWAMPCLPYGGAPDQGFFFIPEVGAGVWIEFEAGELEFPIWVGTYWAKPGGTTEIPKPADAQSPPTRKIIRTLKGSSIEIEDKDKEEVFIIKYYDGAKTNSITMNKDGLAVVDANQNKVTMDKNGIIVEDANKNKATMDDKGMLVMDKNKNKIALDANGAVIEDKNKNKIEMNSAAINIFPAVACNLGSAAVYMVNNLPACLFSGAPHALDAKGHAKILK
jgi:uncharacterized protein involved in type VI secretion and phage assembly